MIDYFFLAAALLAAIGVFKSIIIVPQNKAYIIERLGKYTETKEAGLHFIIPFIDRVAYRHSLKEVAVDVLAQSAITKDNVQLSIDGVLYIKITDPKRASYGIENLYFAITQLAQTTMRSEIGKIALDKTFEERSTLNEAIVAAINEAADSWGLQCMRYEIKDINPPRSVLEAMELQVAAERHKRAKILESEGARQAQINIAEAGKQETVLDSEAQRIEKENNALGEANAIRYVAEAQAAGIGMVAGAILEKGGLEAVALRVAEQYVTAFGKLAKEGTVVLLPANSNDVAGMVAQALSTFDAVRGQTKALTTGKNKDGK